MANFTICHKEMEKQQLESGKNSKVKESPISRKLLMPLTVILLVQALLFSVTILFGGTINKLENNAFDVLNERVINRKNNLQIEMLHNCNVVNDWIEPVNQTVEQTCADCGISPNRLVSDSHSANMVLRNNLSNLVTILDGSNATGAFLILNGQDEINPSLKKSQQKKSALYLRNISPSDPELNIRNVRVQCAPESIINELPVSKSPIYSSDIQFTQGDSRFDFFYKPMLMSQNKKFQNEKTLGYWSPNSSMWKSCPDIITYTVPLLGAYQKPYGILGVEITADSLKRLVLESEVTSNKTDSYILAMHDLREDDYQPVACSGSVLCPNKVKNKTNFTLCRLNEELGYCYRLCNSDAKDGKTMYGCMQKLNLYSSATPYSETEWVLVGLEDKEKLFELPQHIKRMVCLDVVLSMIFGLISMMIISKLFTRPITELVSQMRKSNPQLPISLQPTHITEIDELAKAIEDLGESVADSASKLSQIIQMTSTSIGAFEYQIDGEEVFYTDRFFDVLQVEDNYTTGGILPKSEFQKKLKEVPFTEKKDILTKYHGYIMRLQKNTEDAPRWVRVRLTNHNGKCLGVAEDITQEMAEKEKMERERNYDLLTGLYSRHSFYKYIDERFRNPEQLEYAAAVMVDLDNLKYINDAYGHDCGDEYIRCAAGALQKAMPENGILARISGDEFYLFLWGYHTRKETCNVIDSIKEGIRSEVFELPDGSSLHVQASAGISCYPEDTDNYETLIRYADFAMYLAKNNNKGEFREFDIHTYKQDSYLIHKRAELTRFIDEKLVEYHFQPIVNAHTGKVYGYEALMRSMLPTLRSPMEILTLASRQSRLYQIEKITWYEGLASFSKQKGQENYSLFINTIANQMLSKEDMLGLEKQFSDILSRVVMELTEEEKLNEDFQKQKVEAIRRWNSLLALDDFGTGYNSEITLLSVHPNFIKIDRSIVRNVDKDRNRQEILINMISYCHERGILVIAEGVECAEEMELLIHLGADYLQGYYLGVPGPYLREPREEVKQELRKIASREGYDVSESPYL